MNYSPLRYPGGKNKIYPIIKLILKKSNIKNGVYIEPFAGGSGVALSLLLNNDVDQIVINDYDKAIYSFWRAIIFETNKFIDKIEQTPITVQQWQIQNQIYKNCNKKYSFELGFATFYLNRTNRSGILKAGFIGGYKQDGKYSIDARFNKIELIKKIKFIASQKKRIHIYNKDINCFIDKILPRYSNKLIYFDPPYFNKGKELYTNFFNENDHKRIANKINNLKCPWIVTYDNEENIIQLYKNYECKLFDLTYSVANTGKASEIMFLSHSGLWPSDLDLIENHININLRER